MNESDLHYLLFKIKDSLYALNVTCILEIVLLPELKSLSFSVPGFVGYFNYHQDVIPVLDPAILLGSPATPYSLQDNIIILKDKDLCYGLIIKDVLAISPINLNVSQALLKENLHKTHTQFFSSIALYNEEAVFILNHKNLYTYPSKTLTKEKTLISIALLSQEYEKNILSERAKQLSQTLTSKKNHNLAPFAIAESNKELFGLEVQHIKEFYSVRSFTPFPFSHPYLFGFINLRGMILPLIDSGTFIQSKREKYLESLKVIVIEISQTLFGLVVDDVIDVLLLPKEAIKTSIEKEKSHYLTSTIHYKNAFLGVLDTHKIFKLFSL
ncbi:chemotaxis protein CheW [Parachlamydia acanthamoebae]|uniref:chemotaxis protein CheW n=1 Tax=Parachlamydia acanthamoebae TaxID=83552 RepID=UPI00075087B3|nr:chemotaxis protein CheW [Parachlamydia acanthamoebae]